MNISEKYNSIVRDCCAKFATGLNNVISHSSKSIWVIKLFFCQNISPLWESFWLKDSLITHILFELWLIMIFRPVANFAQQPLCVIPFILMKMSRISSTKCYSSGMQLSSLLIWKWKNLWLFFSKNSCLLCSSEQTNYTATCSL